jgi:hypothetical protein
MFYYPIFNWSLEQIHPNSCGIKIQPSQLDEANPKQRETLLATGSDVFEI